MGNKDTTSKKELTRRDFVKTTSLATSGLMLGSLPLKSSAYVNGSDMLKVAVIGCGKRGTGAAFNALASGTDVKLVAMADIFQDRLDECYFSLSQRYGDSEQLDVPDEHKFIGFDSYKHAIDLADVVLLTTPPGLRPHHYKYAVEKEKHVFMEKPLATDSPGVRSILETGNIAREKKLNVVVGLQRHYQNNYREIMRRIHNRELGDITSGQIYWNQGELWLRERKPEYTELEYQNRNWYYFNWLCGDHIMEQHIHQIDVANWFLGEYPVKAQGMGGREVRTGKEYGEIFDHHFVEFTYPSGAVIASQCRQIPGCFNRVAEDFQATRGFLNIDGGNNAIIRDRNQNVRYNHDGLDDPDPYQQEIVELFESIRRGNVIDNTEYGAKSTLTALMGRMATYSGQVIEWNAALNSQRKLVPDNVDWDTLPPTLPDENGFYPIPIPGQTKVL
ncbi:MAG: Gfo/Idh/MocA family oxidoreductase [Balneolales bacterium]